MHAQTGNEAVGPCAGAHQDTAVAVGSCFGLTMLTVDRTATMKAEVRVGLAQVFEMLSLEEGRKCVRIQQSELDDEMGNGVLTWEEMDSTALQACWD